MVSGPLVIAAIGFTLIFKLDRVMNIAYAEFMTIPAYLTLVFTSAGFDFIISFVLSILAMGAIAIGLYWIFFDGLIKRGASIITLIITSVGLSFVLRNIINAIFTGAARGIPFASETIFQIGEVSFTNLQVVSLISTILIMFGTHFLLKSTKIGREIRAVADSRSLCAIDGISAGRVDSFVWFLSGVYGGFAGVLIAAFGSLSPNLGWNTIIFLIAVVIAGGLGNVYGAMIMGIILIEVQTAITYFLSTEYGFIVAFVVLILTVALRPKGLLGGR